MIDNEEKLSGLPFWNNLEEKQKKFFAEKSYITHFTKNQMLRECMTCIGMIYVLSGKIRTYVISDEGREITLYRLEKGDMCALTASCVIKQITFETQIAVENDCDIIVLPSSDLENLVNENIYVKCFIYELITKRFSTVMWTFQRIIFEKFDMRLSTFLYDQYMKTNKTEIQMTQETIASEVNSAREVVARMLKRFAADGLVELKRGSIIIKDIDNLKRISE